jgi:MFS family permease
MDLPAGRNSLFHLGFLAFLYALGFGLILFLLPFLALDLSESVFMVGVLVSVVALSSLLAAVPSGALVDALGLRKVCVLGFASMAVLIYFLPGVSTVLGFVLFVFLFGASSQLVYAPLKAYLLEVSPEGKTSKYFGVFATVFQLGLALGPLAGGFLILNGFRAGVEYSVLLFTPCYLLALGVFLHSNIGLSKRMRFNVRLRELLYGSIRDYHKLKEFGLIVLWLTILFTTYEGLVWTLEPLFNRIYSLNAVTTGLILSMFTLPFILFNIPAGVLADKYGKVKILAPSLVAAGVFIILFGLTENPILLLVYAFLSTTGLAFTWTSMAGMLADATVKFKKGGVVGMWNTAEQFGYFIAPIIGGLIAEYYTLKIPFMALGVLLILSSLPVLLLDRKR